MAFRKRLRAAVCLVVCALTGHVLEAGRATDHHGAITFRGLPVPGATVTATRDDHRIVTTSDQRGVYQFTGLAEGTWMLQIEMLGFVTMRRDVTIGGDAAPLRWELTLQKLSDLPGIASSPGAMATAAVDLPSTTARPATAPAPERGFQRATLTPAAGAPTPSATPLPPEPGGDAGDASDGFVINGSVNNGAASPFAQPRAFGNNRPGSGSRYTGSAGLVAGNSAWDARPYAFSGARPESPTYADVHVVATLGGPLKIPRLFENRGNLFLGYQRTDDHDVSSASARMPTPLQREGNFIGTPDGSGRQVRITDPGSGLPLEGNVIPLDRVSPQARALLNYYPLPNVSDDGRFNYQAPILRATRQDSLQSRVMLTLSPRSQLLGTFALQRTRTDSTTLFDFEDASLVSLVDTAASWSRRLSPRLWLRSRYQYTRSTSRVTPYFAGRANVSGDAGISGNDQDPVNWGPPALSFASGMAGLSDALPAFTRHQTNAVSTDIVWSRGRQTFTIGGGASRLQVDIDAQQDPRGRLAFTGAASGLDLTDFLFGIPTTSAIALGNANKSLHAGAFDAYVSDDWRVTPVLTATLGVRWEYEAPFTESAGRLVNLDVAPGFAAIAPVLASDPTGAITGRSYHSSLVRPDALGFQPRAGVSWRPLAGSSLVIRAGYGIYRNTSVYEPITTRLAQQPPLSNTFSVTNNPAHPLTLANPFAVMPADIINTFAVDPDFRVGYAQTWQISLQRDLPGSLNVTASYLGTSGHRLPQQILPNTFPPGAVDACLGCPSGFVYLTSQGRSSRHAGQVQLRRRLHNGLSASLQYTLSKADDDVAAFVSGSLDGAAIAQDWRNPAAERAPSNFDQRHVVGAQFEYTTGVGARGGGLLTGRTGSLVKGWVIAAQLTAGSGLPLTPIYLLPVNGTGVTGTIRPSLTGDSTRASDGAYLNAAAYAPPSAGHWGTAGRNSVVGPGQFQLNAGVGRTFPLHGHTSLDWRVDATNVLNRVTFANVDMVFGSSQFGRANLASPMRNIQMTIRARF
jgi:Carboxypeptidase regulatory-like domain